MRISMTAAAAILLVVACQSSQQTKLTDEEAEADVTAPQETATKDAPIDLPTGETDPYLWLEEVEGERALDWVRGQNERTLEDVRSDPRYDTYYQDALDVLTSDERIPYGTIRDGWVYNFWQDETNVRGLWRRTPLESYATDNPDWETIVDFDKLAEEEGKNWVYKGANCFQPEDGGKWLCMVSLSDGGKDAVIQREFDLETKQFVEDGFTTPEAKQGLSWVDADTVLIATDWGEGTVTESGYPFIVKRWTRGTPLEEAEEVLRGEPKDVGVFPMVLEKEDGTRLQGAVVADTFFTSSYYWFPDGESEPVKWPVPPKSSPEGIYKGQFMVSLQQDWAPEGQDKTFKSGDVVAFDLDTFLETRALPEVSLVFHPDESQAVNGIAVADGAALLSINENVVGKVLRLEPGADGWTTSDIALPGKGQSGIAFADKDVDTVFLNYEGFLTPDSLLRYDVATGEISPLKSLPAKFDTTGLEVEQFFATSSDGTKIPYFIIHREDMPLNGSTPTLLYGYGGFQVSLNPSYSAVRGRLWLDEGGAYVLANIRGGGEFGPDWHQAGLKTKRQVIYDDFIAVGEDLIGRGITSTEHLGIMGGSNGGLLMGVMLTQRPDLWDAVVIQVPLLDMLRFDQLLAGASWVDEYGSPDVAEERAFLETISPYHNFDPDADYPTPFFLTSTKDDRVHPGHARKMAKLFEESGKPFLYYENIDGGHSAAANQKETARRTALEYTYLHRRLFPDGAED
ncbi:prolyl oligopeptidase family serine peptidase [Henriciella aquimarina]|uniref:prolyl oligopeptidase family serine peptidase n=1 Tax=Henriciella aquimarina TaxID=545261 RepID=UPI000A00409E|nr:prolyl oligopeptidase family serine peptidase [Henriciella aquimarina]